MTQTPREIAEDYRKRILDGEEIPDEEMISALTRLREARASSTAPRKKAAPKIDPDKPIGEVLGEGWDL